MPIPPIYRKKSKKNPPKTPPSLVERQNFQFGSLFTLTNPGQDDMISSIR